MMSDLLKLSLRTMGNYIWAFLTLLSYVCIRYYLKAFNSARTAVYTVTESLFEDYAVSAFLELDKKVYCVGSIRSGRSVQWR